MNKIWYHGSNTTLNRFTLDHLSTASGVDQHGVGIYLTSSFDDASQYGKHVYTVSTIRSPKILGKNVKTSQQTKLIQTLFKVGDQEYFDNWNEDQIKGANLYLKSLIDHRRDNLIEALEQIWYDMFIDSPKLFLETITKNSGLDGILIDHLSSSEPSTWFICWDPSLLKITETKHLSTAELISDRIVRTSH
jgi:hypothetical protein